MTLGYSLYMDGELIGFYDSLGEIYNEMCQWSEYHDFDYYQVM